MLRSLRRKLRRRKPERPIEEQLAGLPEDVVRRLAAMYRGESQLGTDGARHEIDRITRISALQGQQLFELHRRERPALSVEVGLAYGFSTLCFLAAAREHGGRHVAIDPYAESSWHGIGLAHARAIAAEGTFEHLAAKSSTALPQLADAGPRAGLIYVDGNHRFDDVLVDAILADLLLDEGGLLLLDDTWMPSVQKVLRFLERNRTDYCREECAEKNLAVLRKVAQDERDWQHFVEF